MWQVVFRKEFQEIFGDARTRFNVIVSPLLITPLLIAGIGTLARNQARESEKEHVKVGVIALQSAPSVAEALSGPGSKGLEFVPVASMEQAEEQIRARKLSAAFAIGEGAEERLKSEEPIPVTVIADSGSESSQQASSRIQDFLRERGDLAVAKRLQDRGLSMQTVKPFQIGERKLKGTSTAMLLLTSFLPYILSLSAIMGGMMAATNTVAGEKERGTLETLLVTPAARQSIALGKFMAVTATAIVSGTLSLIGMFWPFYVKLPMFAWMHGPGSEALSLKPVAIIALILVQVPLAVFGSGLLLALSTYARNQKEMQTMAMPVMLLGMVGALLSMLLKAESPLFWAVVPITNAAMVLKQALQGIINLPFIAIACGTSLLYAGIAVLVAAMMFRREAILTRF